MKVKMCLLKKSVYFNLIIIVSVLQNSKFVSTKESHSVVYDKCGEIINKFQFVLQSPGNANKNNLTCEYFLKGPDNNNCHTEFHFQFLDFDLTESENCSNNYLQVDDNEKEKLCGLITGVRMFKTNEKTLKLKYFNLQNEKSFFKILITKLPCYANEKLDVTLINTQPSNLSNCCASSYNSRRFFLSSPGFPNNQESHCSFPIYRANPNICRLRINFKYFWLGLLTNNNECNHGYLSMDGKRICGCQTSIDIISNFDSSWGKNPKILEYKNIGYPNLKYSGFVLEIIQDECPTRYSPTLDSNNKNLNRSKEEKVPQFYYYNDQLNRIQFPTNNTNITGDNRIERQVSASTFDYYFFRAPDNDDDSNTNNYAHDIEERSYFETSNPDFNLPFDNNEYSCRNWADSDFKILSSKVLYQKMVKCGIAQTANPNCYDVKLSKGIIISPGYPFYYPGNLNCCYRIHKLQNYCTVQFNVLDFDVENSLNCNKDYFLLYNKNKYCGHSLQNKLFTMDLTHQSFDELKFMTDNYWCGRGYKIYFQHIPCTFMTPARPPLTSTPPTVIPRCGEEIRTDQFDIIFDTRISICNFVIYQTAPNVCGIELYYEQVNLNCQNELIFINNEQVCGLLTGAKKFVSFGPRNIVTISYRRPENLRPVLTSIVLRGRLVRDECDPFILPPVQRRLEMLPLNTTTETQKQWHILNK